MSTIFSRNNILNALLFIGVAIEFIYNLADKFMTYYRNRGHRHLKIAVVHVIASAIYAYETIKLGAQVVYKNRQQILAQANSYRNAIGRQFVYG